MAVVSSIGNGITFLLVTLAWKYWFTLNATVFIVLLRSVISISAARCMYGFDILVRLHWATYMQLLLLCLCFDTAVKCICTIFVCQTVKRTCIDMCLLFVGQSMVVNTVSVNESATDLATFTWVRLLSFSSSSKSWNVFFIFWPILACFNCFKFPGNFIKLLLVVVCYDAFFISISVLVMSCMIYFQPVNADFLYFTL